MKNTIFILSLFVSFSVFGQKHNSSLHLEILGKSLWYGSLSFENEINEHLSYGVGIGYKSYSTGAYSSLRGEGNYFDIYTAIPLYMQYQFFQKKDHLLAIAGFTIQNGLYLVKYNSGKFQVGYRPYLLPFVGAAYELEFEKIIFRLPVYAVYIGINDWYFPVLPWIGVSVGYKL